MYALNPMGKRRLAQVMKGRVGWDAYMKGNVCATRLFDAASGLYFRTFDDLYRQLLA
jgi:hypothetical protein